MSHFTVLVVGEDVEKQLTPYHEFECTGFEDEYVRDVDVTEEARAEYEKYNTDGRYENFEAFVRAWYGIDEEDEDPKYSRLEKNEQGEVTKVIRRTNPDAKWDWWVIGGRWAGLLKLKEGAEGAYGELGTFDKLEGRDPRTTGYADQARKGDIDFDGMRSEAAKDAADFWDRVHAVVAGREVPKFDDYREKYPSIEEAREQWAQHPVNLDLRNTEDEDVRWVRFGDDSPLFMSREEYIQSRRDGAVLTFAMVKGGQWYQRGQMGWFATVSDEVEKGVWERQFNEALDALPENALLTVVDCHI